MQVEATREKSGARLSLGGRTLETLEVAASAAVDGSDLLFVLDGTLNVDGAPLREGDAVLVGSGPGVRAGAEGCRLARISHADAAGDARQVFRAAPMQWFDKYDARLAPCLLEVDGRDLLAPWTAYRVELAPAAAGVSLHVHHDLTNIVVITGDTGSAGYALGRTGRAAWAQAVAPGDIVVVHPGVEHNLASAPGHPPLRFLVFNDSPSNYQQTSTSDYHDVGSAAIADLELRPRPAAGPVVLEIGPA